MTLEYLLYRSTGRIEQFGDDCTNILRVARLRNADLGLTGFLHAEDGVFVQWLEGPAKALNHVAELICRIGAIAELPSSVAARSSHGSFLIGQWDFPMERKPRFSTGWSRAMQIPTIIGRSATASTSSCCTAPLNPDLLDPVAVVHPIG